MSISLGLWWGIFVVLLALGLALVLRLAPSAEGVPFGQAKTGQADIPGKTIGAIRIQERHTLADVPEKYVAQVLNKAGDMRIHRRAIAIERAWRASGGAASPSGAS